MSWRAKRKKWHQWSSALSSCFISHKISSTCSSQELAGSKENLFNPLCTFGMPVIMLQYLIVCRKLHAKKLPEGSIEIITGEGKLWNDVMVFIVILSLLTPFSGSLEVQLGILWGVEEGPPSVFSPSSEVLPGSPYGHHKTVGVVQQKLHWWWQTDHQRCNLFVRWTWLDTD